MSGDVMQFSSKHALNGEMDKHDMTVCMKLYATFMSFWFGSQPLLLTCPRHFTSSQYPLHIITNCLLYICICMHFMIIYNLTEPRVSFMLNDKCKCVMWRSSPANKWNTRGLLCTYHDWPRHIIQQTRRVFPFSDGDDTKVGITRYHWHTYLTAAYLTAAGRHA